ncbi:MAG: polysaccharide deacetylase family protein [Ferruginibacter sp.]|nr:polysaccharide deacetylase family protein [Ferruginibacter sp.]
MIYWIFLLPAAIVLIALFQRYISFKQPLPVLMYHSVSENGTEDDLTVQSLMLERQFHYLKRKEFTPVLLSQLVDFVLYKKPLPAKPVLITFDDGYRDNYTILYPILKQYGISANIFLVPSLIEETCCKNNAASNQYLKLDDIASMDPSVIEFGLHSYDHRNLNELSPYELNDDITQSKSVLKTLNIPFQPCLAFPYGAYPKKRGKSYEFFETLSRNKIVLAFRIGNRLNPMPLKNGLLIQRLNIKGGMSFKRFTRLVKNGKVLFS